MQEKEVRELIARQRWVFAKTFATFAPHEYIVKGKCNARKEEFEAFMDYILEKGIRMFYYKRERKYLFLDGYFYWICRDSADDPTAVINRCRPDDYDIVFMKRGTQAKAIERDKAKEAEKAQKAQMKSAPVPVQLEFNLGV